MVKEKFYVTTAIDYPNAEPHIGHAYQKIIADVFARWNSLQGKDVFFLTGTDEHGKKIEESAQKANKKPKDFVDEVSKKFKLAWESLNIVPNRFIRTTDKDHEKLVKEVIEKCNKNGDIYLGQYEGLYCTGCEAYYTEKEVVDKKCPLHNRNLELLKEESYFFRLSKYEKYLLELYKKNKNIILPIERKNEMLNRIKEGLKDLSISRTSFGWGIEFPLNKKHITYVWFDALFNYVSGAGKNGEYWPANLQLLGKDNGWFHCVYWPAFLKSAGYDVPKTIFVHGFLTFNGQKISKSLGNSISPIKLVEKYGADSIRYFICRNFVLGEDGDFDEKSLINRHNTELANKLGNLVSRVSALAEKYGVETNLKKMKLDEKWKKLLEEDKLDYYEIKEEFSSKKDSIKMLKIKKEYLPYESGFEGHLIGYPQIMNEVTRFFTKKYMDNYELDKVLNIIFGYIDNCNEFIQLRKPWEDVKPVNYRKWVLGEAVLAIKNIAILLSPFMPQTAEKIAKTFNFKISLEELDKPLKDGKINKSEILFQKIQ